MTLTFRCEYTTTYKPLLLSGMQFIIYKLGWVLCLQYDGGCAPSARCMTGFPLSRE